MEYTHICTNIKDLNNIPIINGQIIFVLDTQQIYVDYDNLRNNVTIGSVSYYQSLKEKMKYSAQKEYFVGDICYYYNALSSEEPGWYKRSEVGVTPGLWNSNYWTLLFDININESYIHSGYTFGSNSLSFGENSIVSGNYCYAVNCVNSFVGGENNLIEDSSLSPISTSLFSFGKNCIVQLPSIAGALFGENNFFLEKEGADNSNTSIGYLISGHDNYLYQYGDSVALAGHNNTIVNAESSSVMGNNNNLDNLSSFPAKNIYIAGAQNNIVNEGYIENIHIEGYDNLISNSSQLISNIFMGGEHNKIESSSEKENIFIFGENLVGGKNQSIYGQTLFGYYNNYTQKNDIIFAIGNGSNSYRTNALAITPDSIQFNEKPYFGQYDLMSPMLKLMEHFTDKTLEDKNGKQGSDAWREQREVCGCMIVDKNFEDFTDKLNEQPMGWNENVGSTDPIVWLTADLIDNEDNILGSLLIECQWITSRDNLSLNQCKYRTCLCRQSEYWESYTDWTDLQTTISLIDNSLNESHFICYDYIKDAEISTTVSTNTFNLTLKMQSLDTLFPNDYSTVVIHDIELPEGVSVELIDNSKTKWSIGSTEYAINWLNEEDICNGKIHNWPIIQKCQTNDILAPFPNVFYEKGALLKYKGIIYESLGKKSQMLPAQERSVLPDDTTLWESYLNYGVGWKRYTPQYEFFQQDKYYHIGDIVLYNDDLYYCLADNYSSTTPEAPNPDWACITNNSLAARVAAIEQYLNI